MITRHYLYLFCNDGKNGKMRQDIEFNAPDGQTQSGIMGIDYAAPQMETLMKTPMHTVIKTKLSRFKPGSLLSLICVLSLNACYTQGQAYSPAKAWPQASLESVGLDPAAVQRATERVGQIWGRQCLAVIKDGKLVHERYYDGDARTQVYVFSLTKSFASTLMGIAISRNWIQLSDRMDSWLDELPWGMHPDATVEQVLSQVAESTPPGSEFHYNSGAVLSSLSQVLGEALARQGIDMTPEEFAYAELLEPLGMENSRWESTDNRGNLRLGLGMRSTCRDAARLGQLFLNGGRWQNQQILDSSYVQAATRSHYPEANPVQGYLWWLNPSVDKWIRPLLTGSGQLIPTGPESMYMATGVMGNFIFVLPEEQMVIVSLGRSVNWKIESLITGQQIFAALAEMLPETAAKP